MDLLTTNDIVSSKITQGHVAQSVTCLNVDACLTADLRVASLILAQSQTFMDIDNEIISTDILLPSADSRRVVVSYKRSLCTCTG